MSKEIIYNSIITNCLNSIHNVSKTLIEPIRTKQETIDSIITSVSNKIYVNIKTPINVPLERKLLYDNNTSG